MIEVKGQAKRESKPKKGKKMKAKIKRTEKERKKKRERKGKEKNGKWKPNYSPQSERGSIGLPCAAAICSRPRSTNPN